MARKDSVVIHSVRLGLGLNFSVFHFEVLQNLDVACKTARVAFEDAIAEPDQQALKFGVRSVIAKEMFSSVKLAREIDESVETVTALCPR